MNGFSLGFRLSSTALFLALLLGNQRCLVDQVRRIRSRRWNRSGLWWYSSFISSVTCTFSGEAGVSV